MPNLIEIVLHHFSRWHFLHDARSMRRTRADYYAYIRDLLIAQNGKRSLRDMFSDDAYRYGPNCARGRLSAQWEKAFEISGGRLSHTWEGVFPDSDLALIAVAQDEGAEALAVALGDLSHMTTLVQRLGHIITTTLMAGVVALLVLVGVLSSVSYLTVPRLLVTFASVPPSLWSFSTRALVAFSDLLVYALPASLLLICLGGLAVTICLPRWVSRWRHRLDTWPVFKLYRDLQAIRFLSSLVLLVHNRQGLDVRLREALMTLSLASTPWMQSHLHIMLSRLDDGDRDGRLFNTGLFDLPTYWFMSDVIVARGLSDGLGHARVRTEAYLVARVTRQALVLRWVLLLSAVGSVLGIALWHMQVIDALRRALSYVFISG